MSLQSRLDGTAVSFIWFCFVKVYFIYLFFLFCAFIFVDYIKKTKKDVRKVALMVHMEMNVHKSVDAKMRAHVILYQVIVNVQVVGQGKFVQIDVHRNIMVKIVNCNVNVLMVLNVIIKQANVNVKRVLWVIRY